MQQNELTETSIPNAALIPGLAGLIPFWFLALMPLFGLDIAPVIALYILNVYGAVILSFVGAIWWGVAVATPGAPRTAMFTWSVVPALIGWFAAAIAPADIGLLILMVAFAGQWSLDVLVFGKISISPWVVKLRTILTAGVVISLACAWWMLV